MVTGIVLTGVGALGLLVGAVVYSKADTDEDLVALCDVDGEFSSGCGASQDDIDGRKATGAGLMIAGGVGIAVGIPLLVVGARKVPVKQDTQQQKAPEASFLRVGPRGASVRFAF